MKICVDKVKSDEAVTIENYNSLTSIYELKEVIIFIQKVQ